MSEQETEKKDATPTATAPAEAESSEASTVESVQDAPKADAVVEEPKAEKAPPVVEQELVIAPDVPRLGRPLFSAMVAPFQPLPGAPSAVFLVLIATGTFVSDIATKIWAEKTLDSGDHFTVFENSLQFAMAHNYGGAFGLLGTTSEAIRRPFFLLVSVAAIAFIGALYRKLTPKQVALKWGLPLVLGGALGNVFDRIRYGFVIDFIDYRADWVRKMNEFLVKYSKSTAITDHWPTFNVADVAICIGVILMAIDMFTARRGEAYTPAPLRVPVDELLTTPPSDSTH